MPLSNENSEGKNSPQERAIDMEKVEEFFFKKIKGKAVQEIKECRSRLRQALLRDPHVDLPFYLKTADEASEALYTLVTQVVVRNFSAEESKEILDMFINKLHERLDEKDS